jgi:hypothetical protein
MLNTIIASMFLFSSFVHGSEYIELSLGPHYANYGLRQNEEEVKNQWNLGGEIALYNFVPNIGIKIRGTKLEYDVPFDGYNWIYEYTRLLSIFLIIQLKREILDLLQDSQYS